MPVHFQKIPHIFKFDPKTYQVIFGEFEVPELEYIKDIPFIGTEKLTVPIFV